MDFELPVQPHTIRKGRVDFSEMEFRQLIAQKGLVLEWSQAAMCPCSTETEELNLDLSNLDPSSFSSSVSVACPHCRGTGKIYHSPQEIKGVIASADTEYTNLRFGGFKDGTISISVNPEHLPSQGDRFVLKDSVMVYNEVLVYDGSPITETTFPIIERAMTLAAGDVSVGVLYMTSAPAPTYLTTKVEFTAGVHFTIVDGAIQWIIPPAVKDRITVVYYMNPSYTCVSFPKSVRDSRSIFKSDNEFAVPLPVNFNAKLEFLDGSGV